MEGYLGMNVHLDRDGKFIDRLVASCLGAIPALVIGGIIYWADSRQTDARQADALARVNGDLTTVRDDIRRVQERSDTDRAETMRLRGDVQTLIATTGRTERSLDALNTRLERLLERQSPGWPPR